MDNPITLPASRSGALQGFGALEAFYTAVRNRTVELCTPLKPEDHLPQPFEHVSPPKWHLAHTTWFFEEFILKACDPGYREYDSAFGFLFNSYYNNVGNRIARNSRGLITRPDLNEVHAYRAHVDSSMLSLIGSRPGDGAFENLVVLGLNHEQQHQELLLADLKLILFQNPLFPVYREGYALTEQANSSDGVIEMLEGVYRIGNTGEEFCFDNELRQHNVYLYDYAIDNYLVTNGDFIDFIESGGYDRPDLWLDEGWSWIRKRNISSPLYWVKQDGQWKQYTLGGLRPVDRNHILAHVNYYEASAFALWAGKRLPTEYEWETASAALDWGHRWEWTQSAYLPYPGFRIAEGALGEYNGKFMVNQMVLRGASSATAAGHSRPSYRNFFHPGYRWQFAGIRLATHTTDAF